MDRVVAAGLANPIEHVLAHAAWAALEVGRSKSGVEEAVRKAVKADLDLAPRADVIRSSLADGSPKPWHWGGALPTIHGVGFNPDIQAWLDEGLGWFGKNDPACGWLVAAVFERRKAAIPARLVEGKVTP